MQEDSISCYNWLIGRGLLLLSPLSSLSLMLWRCVSMFFGFSKSSDHLLPLYMSFSSTSHKTELLWLLLWFSLQTCTGKDSRRHLHWWSNGQQLITPGEKEQLNTSKADQRESRQKTCMTMVGAKGIAAWYVDFGAQPFGTIPNCLCRSLPRKWCLYFILKVIVTLDSARPKCESMQSGISVHPQWMVSNQNANGCPWWWICYSAQNLPVLCRRHVWPLSSEVCWLDLLTCSQQNIGKLGPIMKTVKTVKNHISNMFHQSEIAKRMFFFRAKKRGPLLYLRSAGSFSIEQWCWVDQHIAAFPIFKQSDQKWGRVKNLQNILPRMKQTKGETATRHYPTRHHQHDCQVYKKARFSQFISQKNTKSPYEWVYQPFYEARCFSHSSSCLAVNVAEAKTVSVPLPRVTCTNETSESVVPGEGL